MAPRVCFDLTPLASGSRLRGIGMYVFELARAMHEGPPSIRAGLDLCFLVGRSHRMHVAVGPPEELAATFEGWIQPHVLYQASKRVFGRAALRGVDLFHAAEAVGMPHVGLRRTVVTCHDIIPTVLGGSYLGVRPRWLSLFYDKLRYLRPDHVICISEATRDDIVRVVGVPKERITVVHHGVDGTRYRPPVDGEITTAERGALESAIGTPRPYFLYVGAFDERKRVPLLVEAFARIAHEVDEDLVIAGAMRPKVEEHLHSIAERGGVAGRVHLLQFAPHELLPILYRGATAHVLSSIYEGFGLTILEAMASGCPVVACDASAMPEVCADAALMIPPDDVEAMSRAMVTLSKDRGARGDLRAKGIARASSFTWEKAAKRTLDVYRQVVGAAAR